MINKAEDYRSDINPSWCKGCTFYSVLQAVTSVLAKNQISPRDITVISGIGCSSRMPLYLKTNGMHTLHGRAIPVAIGARLGRPDIPVMVIGGDGDLFSIGIGHFIHAAHKNFDMTVICLDNQMYAMTKNQVSPTSFKGQPGTLCPGGKLTDALSGLQCAISSGATFVARTSASLQAQMLNIISGALEHKGFSYVEITAPCRTYGSAILKPGINSFVDVNNELNHNPADKTGAMKLLSDSGDESYKKILTGIFWKKIAPVYEDLLNGQNNQVSLQNVSEILDTMIDSIQ
ncbi:MAG: 2-oxoacid:ferredoxin oxidoreductase subunit beta [Fibrobacter sp.]|nr:2-oxoacid:ferredoxin oxidoreductase subunit beta [Fibrobacter sp.]